MPRLRWMLSTLQVLELGIVPITMSQPGYATDWPSPQPCFKPISRNGWHLRLGRRMRTHLRQSPCIPPTIRSSEPKFEPLSNATKWRNCMEDVRFSKKLWQTPLCLALFLVQDVESISSFVFCFQARFPGPWTVWAHYLEDGPTVRCFLGVSAASDL